MIDLLRKESVLVLANWNMTLLLYYLIVNLVLMAYQIPLCPYYSGGIFINIIVMNISECYWIGLTCTDQATRPKKYFREAVNQCLKT